MTSKSQSLSKKLLSLHDEVSSDEREISRRELKALADSALGPTYDENKINAVFALQQALRRQQELLVIQLDRQILSKRQYLDRVNAEMRQIYGECEKILGRADFERLFGTPLEQVDHLIDSDLFLTNP